MWATPHFVTGIHLPGPGIRMPAPPPRAPRARVRRAGRGVARGCSHRLGGGPPAPGGGAGDGPVRGRPRHSSLWFLRPSFLRNSFSALIRSPSHGWDGLSYFRRENFGSPNPSLLLLLLAALFLFRGLRGGDRRLLDHAHGKAGAPVAPRPLPAHLLALLVPDPAVAPDHLHPVDVVPQAEL